MLYLENIEINFPKKSLNISEDYEILGIDILKSKVFTRLYGFLNCPIETDSEKNLLISTIEKLINTSKIKKQDIHYIIHAHTGPNIGLHGNNYLKEAKNKLELKYACCFGTQLNKCVSIISAFDILDKLMKDLPKSKKAIILIGEVANSRELRILDSAVVGDVGVALLVNNSGKRGSKILALAIDVHDEYAKGIWMDSSSQLSRSYDENYQNNLLKIIQKVLNQANLKIDEIKIILPHNVNIQIWKKAIVALKIPEEQVYLKNISKFAHCFGADIIINYFTAIKEKIIKPKDLCLMITVGVGGIFGACVIKNN